MPQVEIKNATAFVKEGTNRLHIRAYIPETGRFTSFEIDAIQVQTLKHRENTSFSYIRPTGASMWFVIKGYDFLAKQLGFKEHDLRIIRDKDVIYAMFNLHKNGEDVSEVIAGLL